VWVGGVGGGYSPRTWVSCPSCGGVRAGVGVPWGVGGVWNSCSRPFGPLRSVVGGEGGGGWAGGGESCEE